MAQSPSWEANRCSGSQEISRILWNPKVHNRIRKNTPTCPYPWPDQSSLCCIPPIYPCIFQVVPLLQVSPRKPCRLFTSHLPHTCYMPCHPILLYFVTRIIFGEQHSSLLHAPVTSSLSTPNISLSTMFPNPQPICFSWYYRPIFTPIQNNRKKLKKNAENILCAGTTKLIVPFDIWTRKC